MLKHTFVIFIWNLFFFTLSATGQQNINLKLFADKFKVTQNNPSIEFCFSIENNSRNKVAILNPGTIGFGPDSSASWIFNICYSGTRKYIFSFDMPYWKDLEKYYTLKPLQKRYFSVRINFNELSNYEFSENSHSVHQLSTISDIIKQDGKNDFGRYEVWLEYSDNIHKNKNSINQELKSNILEINYLKNN